MQNSKVAIYIFLKDITLDGGAERIVFNMANEFVKRYGHVSLISRFSNCDAFHYQLDARVRTHFIEPRGTSATEVPDKPLSRLWYLFKYQWRITVPIKRILHRHTPEGYTPVLLILGYETPLLKPKGAKFIGVDASSAIVWRSPRLLGRLYMAVRRLLQNKLDVVGVLSDQQLDDWAVLGKPVRILTNFVTDIPVQVLPQMQREKMIVAAGRLWPGKGFDRLIGCYSTVAADYPQWRLCIFGDGPFRMELQQMIDDRHMEQYIELVPFTKDIYAEFGRASIYAMTSRAEGFGLVTTEAMACGAVPVAVASNKPSGASFILRDMPECLAAENDMAGFLQILQTMMQDVERRQQVADKGRKVVQERFSPEALMQTWGNLFDELTLTSSRF